VTERDELVGKISFVSRLPQYLKFKQMDQLMDQAFNSGSSNALDNSDVDWR